MNKIELLYGVIIGFFTAFLGIYLFLALFTNYEITYAFQVMKAEGFLGKLITVGAALNIGMFFFLLKIKKELMARGVVLATILLTIITLFI